MKLLLALLISVFSMSAFAQLDIDLSKARVNAKICKSIESEIQSLTKEIIVLSRELEKLRSIKNPSREIIAQIKKLSEKIEGLKKRLAALSAFYEKHCKKDVVDCDQLKLKIASLQKELIAQKDQLSSLYQELKAAEKAEDKRRALLLKAKIASLESDLGKLSKALNVLKQLYKKHCE
jgi:chromosome segregation ATPase